jgi:hypothetical protein
MCAMRKKAVKTVLTIGACVAMGLAVITTLWPGWAAAHSAPRPPVHSAVQPTVQASERSSCYAVSPATARPAQCLVMTDPDAAGLAIWGVPGGPAGATPETEWFDYLGQPIATLGQTGGFKVYGDQVCVYPPTNVFVPDACLRDNGTVTVGGQVLSPSDIAWLHAARAAYGLTATPP